jgi:Kdo2-lipid IVA lauroyltransferase/acyltransferase
MNAGAQSPHARTGETWTTWQRRKNDVLFVAASAALSAAQRAPAALLQLLGFSVAQGTRLLAWPLRRRALANLGIAFPGLLPHQRRRLWKDNTRTLARHLVDAILQLGGRAPIYFDVHLTDEAKACLQAAREGGQGVLFVSAHLGPWEQVARALAAADIGFLTVAREPYDRRFRWVYEALRAQHGVRMLYRGDPGAGIQMMRCLRRGAVLGMPADLATRGPSLPAKFFGHPVLAPSGVARLSLRAGCAVVVGTVDGSGPAQYDDRGRRVLPITATRVELPPSALDPKSEKSADAEARLTQRLLDSLAARIATYPSGWLWMHPRFCRASSVLEPEKQGT